MFTIEMSGSADLTLELSNNTTGKSFVVTALPVSTGDELVIDCDAQTVQLAGVKVMSYFSGEFLTLDPGNNTLELTLAGVTLAGVTLASIVTAFTKCWL